MKVLVEAVKLVGYGLAGYWAGRVVGAMVGVALIVKLVSWAAA